MEYPDKSYRELYEMTFIPEKAFPFIAVNHVIEAATTILNNPFSITLGQEVMNLIAKYLPISLDNPEDLTARYYLAYAAMIAGTSFDNGMLHFTHALEHPLCVMRPELPYALGLSVLLPAIIKAIYQRSGVILADLLAANGSKTYRCAAEEADRAADDMRAWLATVGITEKMGDIGFKRSDIPRLVQLAFETSGLKGLMDCAPIPYDEKFVEMIYSKSF